jgi:hypothetical protein
MSTNQYQLGSYSPGLSGYAPADFLDAADTSPSEMALDPTFSGTHTPYTQIVSNVSNRQLQEIKEKAVIPAVTALAWRKRVKEFMLQKNEDLLSFLRKPLSSHPTLHQTDMFMRKFGMTHFTATHHTLRDIFLDASGVSLIPKIEADLQKIGPSSSTKVTEQVRWLYDEYRLAGNEVMKNEASLRLKLDILDKMHQKTVGLLELPMNDQSGPLQEATLNYLSTFFKDQNIEEDYTRYIESYRKFASLKEMITTFRFTENVDKEPLCCICLNESVSHCITPCGHTFCSTCVKRQMTSCYMCRATVKDRVRIYFG